MGEMSNEERQAHKGHPDYSRGFFDASAGLSSSEDAAPYCAGRQAYEAVAELMVAYGFTRTADGWTKRTVITPAPSSSPRNPSPDAAPER